MRKSRIHRPLAMLLGVALSLFAANSVARAEGEAGLVVDFGNGEVITYCVAFEGNDISGAQMMTQVGLNVNQFSGLVCAIDGTGCQHSGTFDSCTCECKAGSGSCTYWSFFNQRYGASWVYSGNGFQTARSKDGDLQAWKWGPGGANSAPAPGAISFEQVCGHAPQGGSDPPTATLVPPTATPPPPTLAPTSPPATSAPATNAPATTATGSTPRVTITAAASAAASPSNAPATESSTTPGTSAPTGSPAATGTNDPATTTATGSPAATASPGGTTISPSVAPRQTITPTESGDGSSNTTNLVAFGVIAGLLAAAIGVAVIRGRAS